MNNMMRSRYW